MHKRRSDIGRIPGFYILNGELVPIPVEETPALGPVDVAEEDPVPDPVSVPAEFYNQSHQQSGVDGGRFTEGPDGPGRIRDNAKKAAMERKHGLVTRVKELLARHRVDKAVSTDAESKAPQTDDNAARKQKLYDDLRAKHAERVKALEARKPKPKPKGAIQQRIEEGVQSGRLKKKWYGAKVIKKG